MIIYDLPLWANDLGNNERFSTFDHKDNKLQKFGYDISGVRLAETGKWSSLKVGVTEDPNNPKNENRVIHGKPFYAARDGTIVAGWRNAPENPRPKKANEQNPEKKLWLHEEFRKGRIPGGGNCLFIVHDDGTMALYAHAQTGSIPASLCPINDKFLGELPTSGPTENEFGLDIRANVPIAQRRRVRAGDFLGRVGNSGNSEGPHLHFHVQKKGPSSNNDDWEGIPISFRRGLAQPRTSGLVDMETWESFSGKPIPKGKVVFWPPTRLTEEYARHRFDDALMQRLWDHLTNSGFMPEIIDGYSVAGEVFYNLIWRPADGTFRGFFGQTSSELQDHVDKAKEDGFAPVFVDSYSSKHGVRYAVIFKKVDGLFRMRHDISTADHDKTFQLAKNEGLQPVNVSVVSVGGQRRYTVLYRQHNLSDWVLRSQIPENDYQSEVDDHNKADRYPVSLNVYKHQGKNWFSVVFAKQPSPNWTASHGMTSATYQTKYDDARRLNMLTRTIAGYDGAISNHVYAAMWRK